MTQKRISAAEPTPVRVTIVTLDDHLAGTVARAQTILRRTIPGLSLTLHSAAQWGDVATSYAKAIGLAGVVVQGCVRDTDLSQRSKVAPDITSAGRCLS